MLFSRLPAPSRISFFGPLLCALLVLVFAGRMASAALPGSTGKQQSAPPTATPPDAGPLFDELDEIDHLNVLNPLKFTADQLDKMIDTLSTMQADYTRKLNALSATFLTKTADEIRATKKSALTGAPVPPEFIDKVNAVLKQRTDLQAANLRTLSETFRTVWTAQQQAAAANLSRDFEKKLGHSTKGTDEQWCNYYILHVIMDYPRIIPLLKEMRAVAPSANASVGTAPVKA